MELIDIHTSLGMAVRTYGNVLRDELIKDSTYNVGSAAETIKRYQALHRKLRRQALKN